MVAEPPITPEMLEDSQQGWNIKPSFIGPVDLEGLVSVPQSVRDPSLFLTSLQYTQYTLRAACSPRKELFIKSLSYFNPKGLWLLGCSRIPGDKAIEHHEHFHVQARNIQLSLVRSVRRSTSPDPRFDSDSLRFRPERRGCGTTGLSDCDMAGLRGVAWRGKIPAWDP